MNKSVAFTASDCDLSQDSPRLWAGGLMGPLVRNHPWAATPLGLIEDWSPDLIALVNLALNSPVPSAVYWGPELIMIYNDAYAYNIGDKHPEALGASAREVWKDLWPRFGDRCEAVLLEGKPCIEERVSLVFEVDGKSLETFWNFTLTPVFEHGKVAGVYKTDQNVTEEVNTMHALIESDERLRMALSAGDCLAIWDWDLIRDSVVIEGRYLDLRREVQGMSFASMMLMVHPDDHEGIYAAIAESIRTGEDYQREYRLLHPEGSTRRAMSKARCIYGDDGEPLRFIGVTFDLSAQDRDPGSTGRQKPVTTEEFLQGASALIQPTSIVTPLLLKPNRNEEVESVSQISRAALTIPKMVVSLVRKVVTDKDEVDLRTSGDCDSTTLFVSVSPQDFHKMFLGESITFHALQTLLNAASAKLSHRFTLEIADSHGNLLPTEIETIH